MTVVTGISLEIPPPGSVHSDPHVDVVGFIVGTKGESVVPAYAAPSRSVDAGGPGPYILGSVMRSR